MQRCSFRRGFSPIRASDRSFSLMVSDSAKWHFLYGLRLSCFSFFREWQFSKLGISVGTGAGAACAKNAATASEDWNRNGVLSVASRFCVRSARRIVKHDKMNSRLRKLVAEQALANAMLKEVAEGNW